MRKGLPRIAVTSFSQLAYISSFLPSSSWWQKLNCVKVQIILYLYLTLGIRQYNDEVYSIIHNICDKLFVAFNGVVLYGSKGGDMKYTILIQDSSRHGMGYVFKVPASDTANQNIISEYNASLFLDSLDIKSFLYPAFRLTSIRIDNCSCPIIQSDFRKLSNVDAKSISSAHISILSEIFLKTHRKIPLSTSLLADNTILDISFDSHSFQITEECIKYLNLDGNAYIHISMSHGDFTPWNLKRDLSSGVNPIANLFLYDWEKWSIARPVGFDLIHFHLQPLLVSASPPSQLSIFNYISYMWHTTPFLKSYDFNAYMLLYSTIRHFQLIHCFKSHSGNLFWQAINQQRFVKFAIESILR